MKITNTMLDDMANYTVARQGVPAGWIYLGDQNNERYILGEPKEKNILVIGVNPGMSLPGEKRVTTRKVTAIIEQCFGANYGWIMVNLHPQRNSDPKKITPNDTMTQNNLQVIKYVVEKFAIKKIWCAWGNAIDKVGNGFLHTSLENIYNMISELAGNREWYHYGELTKRGNPRHPRFVPLNWKMIPYNPLKHTD